jgi:GNAT superfamily N-acetyltransferase
LALPAGFEFREHDAEWMNAEMANHRFENGVGAAGKDGRELRNRFALGLYDASGELAAIAGAFDTYGTFEIGVDVLRQHRGLGLGRLVVSAMAREIMRRGEVPFYGCGATNIRSHRTAEGCGFRAVLSDATVSTPL